MKSATPQPMLARQCEESPAHRGSLAARAGAHAENLGLRGYDAVHLATALELGDEEIVLVTWDRDLAQAAERVGIGIAGFRAAD